MESTPAPADLNTLMTLGFYILTLVYAIFSAVFYYHWMQYSVDAKVRNASLFLYLLTTLPLVALMGTMIFLQ